jgi:hypothetical protein
LRPYTPQFVENTIQTQNGDQKTDPIIIDVDGLDEESISVPSGAVAPLTMLTKIPPRQIKVVDDDASQTSVKVDLTDSAQLDDEFSIASRVTNKDFSGDIVLPACLVIYELPSYIDLCDIKRLLCASGFSSSR